MIRTILKHKILKLKLSTLVLAAFISTAAFYGCGEDTIAPKVDNLDMSVMSTADTTDNIGILVLDTVKVLINDIKLNVANSNQDSINFKVGPYALFLNLNSSVNVMSTAYIPEGTYDKVRFMVHKLGDNETPPDPEFVDANGRYSVVVKGWFNSIYFVYKSTKSAHQKLTFENSLQVSVSGKSNITLRIKPYIWFIENGVYLDPAEPNNRNDIDNNIKDNINNNFKIFVDNDRNGVPD